MEVNNMQHTTKWKITPLAILLGALFSSSIYAEENSQTNGESNTESTSEAQSSCIWCNVGGSASLAYDSNLYDTNDYRSVRNFSWNGTLNYKLSDKTGLYFSTGGYRALEDKVGTYATDSVFGASYSNIYEFGETGKIGLSGQLTIPTSEISRDTKLYTAIRISTPIRFQMLGGNYSVTPRVRKNFYKYETMNGRVLTEWVYSISVGGSYSFDDLTIGASALGGNGMSYKGTRSRQFTYGASAYASYGITDNWSTSFTVSTAGFYSDAERGTLGNIDLFDTDKATYIAQLTFSF
ncbi:TPA: hypothetical protein I7671_05520 [Vibrio vulnificus]|nr:hypothetical protein [Vibrio vulnificus]